ncbi:hypothetical protein P4H71_13035 [Paenibacillus kribbensis]|uniref:hypothetical protein n=1 Tax=Paenibacillus kribbensis TaxID=172713 RepID=UPI002DB86483|nr:hypothetical protein [Paenibacillus kribbensis]MEC0235246.1 hypothetical protein [Paenibacillus kribbensis]
MSTLQNIYQQDFYNFFKTYGVDNWRKRTEAKGREARYQAIKRVIDEELHQKTGRFGEDELDYFLFDQMYYQNLSYQHIYKFDNLHFPKKTTREEAEEFFHKFPELCFNSKLTEDQGSEDYKLHSRIVKLMNIKILKRDMILFVKSIPKSVRLKMMLRRR